MLSHTVQTGLNGNQISHQMCFSILIKPDLSHHYKRLLHSFDCCLEKSTNLLHLAQRLMNETRRLPTNL